MRRVVMQATGRLMLAMAVLWAGIDAGPVLAEDDVCQASWERLRRIRIELGYRAGPETRPHDPLLLPEVCQLLLDQPEDELRAAMKEILDICGNECRDRLPR